MSPRGKITPSGESLLYNTLSYVNTILYLYSHTIKYISVCYTQLFSIINNAWMDISHFAILYILHIFKSDLLGLRIYLF